MKWFDKWFAKKSKEAWENTKKENIYIEKALNTMHDPIPSRVDNEKTMTFKITKANGGWVIEHYQYDKKSDRNKNGIHIVTDDKNLGEELSKIITYENLFR